MDKIKNVFSSIKNTFKEMKTGQLMKLGAAFFLLFGGGALALAAAQEEDEIIDVADAVDVIDAVSEESNDTVE